MMCPTTGILSRAMRSLLVLIVAFASTAVPSTSFVVPSRTSKVKVLWADSSSTTDDDDSPKDLKQRLYKLAASFDRGYGATTEARRSVDSIIQSLKGTNERRNIADSVYNTDDQLSLLDGTYRMIWTTALDVLSLEVSPIFSTGAIHQVFQGRSVTNVIDFIPRVQSILPISSNLNSMVRAKVQTRACQPSVKDSSGNRVGLIFESVQVQPKQLLGLDTSTLPALAVDLPKLPGTGDESPGYFDVLYLDDELLIIQQSQPGGLFALVRVDSVDS